MVSILLAILAFQVEAFVYDDLLRSSVTIMADQNKQKITRVTDLRVDDRIIVRSIDTGKEDEFLVVGFDFEVINGRPEVTARLHTPQDEPGSIIVFDAPDGICLSPTDIQGRDEIPAEVILDETPQQTSGFF